MSALGNCVHVGDTGEAGCGGSGEGKWPNWSYYLYTCCLCLLFLCSLVNVWGVTSCRLVSSTLMDGGRGTKGEGGVEFQAKYSFLRGHQSRPPDRQVQMIRKTKALCSGRPILSLFTRKCLGLAF